MCVYIFLVQYASFQADERVVNFEGGTGGQPFFALRLVIDDILVAGGIVHDERAGEPGKMGGEFVADTYVRRAPPGTAIGRAPGGTAEIQAFFFIRAFLRIVFPRFYFSDSGPEKYSGRITVSLQKRKTPKTILASSRFPGGSPAAAGFEDIRTGAQFAACSLYRRRFISSTPTSGGCRRRDAFGPNRRITDGVVSD